MFSYIAAPSSDLLREPPMPEGVHRKMARQPWCPQVGLQGGHHTGDGERQATPAPFGRNHGEQVPGG